MALHPGWHDQGLPAPPDVVPSPTSPGPPSALARNVVVGLAATLATDGQDLRAVEEFDAAARTLAGPASGDDSD